MQGAPVTRLVSRGLAIGQTETPVAQRTRIGLLMSQAAGVAPSWNGVSSFLSRGLR